MITNALRGALCFGCVLAVSLSGTPALAVVTSTFDSNAEGWTVFNGGTSSWSGVIGNPAGSVVGVEAAGGTLWYFVAPAAYIGDQSGSYGGSLSWETIALDAGSLVTGTVADVVLKGPAGAVGYAIPNNAPVLGSWTQNTATLNETGWYIIDFPNSLIPTSTPATQEQFQAILSNLTGVYLQGEYFNGSDSSALDNVQMKSLCLADFDGSSFVDIDDFIDFVHAFEEGVAAADVDDSGFVDLDDYTYFVFAFEAGC